MGKVVLIFYGDKREREREKDWSSCNSACMHYKKRSLIAVLILMTGKISLIFSFFFIFSTYFVAQTTP